MAGTQKYSGLEIHGRQEKRERKAGFAKLAETGRNRRKFDKSV